MEGSWYQATRGDVSLCYDALSFKGNAYWVAREKLDTRRKNGFTSKIKPTTVSWSKFLEVDMRPFITGRIHVFTQSRGFFIDEEKKVVVFIGVHEYDDTRKIGYINGEDGYFRKVEHFQLQPCAFLCSKFRAHQASFLLTC
ncbi:hypothetical protein Bca4012_060035 [Brassica carinata]